VPPRIAGRCPRRVWDFGPRDVSVEQWTGYRTILDRCGLAIEDRSPPRTRRVPAEWDPARIPGWEKPARCGLTLLAHQREAVRFLLGRDGRALLADEMGLGKTASAIAAAAALGTSRRLVICPANARFVWEREIVGWSDPDAPPPTIKHVVGMADAVGLPGEGWVVATYDSVTPRAETVPVGDLGDYVADLKAAFRHPAMRIGALATFDPALADASFLAALESFAAELPGKPGGRLRAIVARLAAPNFRALQAWRPDLVIVDEAHRIKNRDAARTRTVRALLADPALPALLLTGTPLRNNELEGATLVEAIDPGAVRRVQAALCPANVWTAGRATRIDAVRTLLDRLMLRRLKADVLDLPAKRHIDVPVPLDLETCDAVPELMAKSVSQ
jgi:SNF2 domain-containing protein